MLPREVPGMAFSVQEDLPLTQGSQQAAVRQRVGPKPGECLRFRRVASRAVGHLWLRAADVLSVTRRYEALDAWGI
jgi:hypothetical protein